MSPTYRAFVFLSDESDFTIPAAADRLSSRSNLSGVQVERLSDSELHLLFDDWRLKIVEVRGDHVLEEAREIATMHSGCEHADEVARCDRRAEIWSEDPDPDMDHFDDDLLTVEAVIGSFRGAFAIDLASGEWW